MAWYSIHRTPTGKVFALEKMQVGSSVLGKSVLRGNTFSVYTQTQVSRTQLPEKLNTTPPGAVFANNKRITPRARTRHIDSVRRQLVAFASGELNP